MPTYNEAENIEKIIMQIMSMCDEVYLKIIDDNSPDGTGDVVSKLLPTFPHLSLLSRSRKNGLGKAYINGFREVIKDNSVTHIFMMDADMSHNPIYIKEMVLQSTDYDLVIGSRYIKGGGTVGWELWRRMLSFFGNMYARIVTRMPVKDMTGGFNCINIEKIKEIDLDSLDSSGYAFIMQLKYSLFRNNASIKEIPIIFVNRLGGESKISNNIISEGILAPWKMIWKK